VDHCHPPSLDVTTGAQPGSGKDATFSISVVESPTGIEALILGHCELAHSTKLSSPLHNHVNVKPRSYTPRHYTRRQISCCRELSYNTIYLYTQHYSPVFHSYTLCAKVGAVINCFGLSWILISRPPCLSLVANDDYLCSAIHTPFLSPPFYLPSHVAHSQNPIPRIEQLPLFRNKTNRPSNIHNWDMPLLLYTIKAMPNRPLGLIGFIHHIFSAEVAIFRIPITNPTTVRHSKYF
jgi:hypothetical protein